MDTWQDLFNVHGDSIAHSLAQSLVRVGYIHSRKRPVGSGDSVANWTPSHAYFPATAVRWGDQRVLVTAGHVLSALANTAADPNRKTLEFTFACGLQSYSDPQTLRIPPAKIRARWVDDDRIKLDVGVVLLDDEVWTEIDRCGTITACDRRDCKVDFEPDLFGIAGFPTQERVTKYDTSSDGLVARVKTLIALVPMHAVADNSKGTGRVPRLKGVIIANQGTCGTMLQNMQGMSGGPIFAIKLESTGFRYGILAVQSTESELDGSVSGCYLRAALSFLMDNRFEYGDISSEECTVKTLAFGNLGNMD